ncbi:MAG: 6-bladed beta-propeller [Candidatus Aminicenantes bacterium]|nr:6-bladed beta-propeller [Candidatus Aminicenantes bacterium]
MNRRIRLVLLLFTLCVFVLSMGCQKQDSAWKGTISEEDGVTVVKNPKEPMYGVDVFSLVEELAITDEAGGEECIFSNIIAIDIDETGRIYILDYRDAHVYIFDTDGTYIKTFGRKGQGPGELNMPITMKALKGNMLAVENLRNCINFYSLEGDFIREVQTATAGAMRVTIDSHGNVFGTLVIRDEENPRYELVKFDPEMNKICSLGSSPLASARKGGYNPFGGSFVYNIRYDDYIVFGNHEKYEIDIYDPSGKLIKKISKDYDPVEITKEEKDRIPPPPGDIKVSIPKYHNPYSWFLTDDEGRIFVQTYEQVEEGGGYIYDVFDIEGKCLVKIPLKSTPRLIKKKKLYTVESDKEGFLTVKRYRIDWNI